MAFPNYKRKFIFRVPDGWEDTGEIGNAHDVEHGETVIIRQLHKFCMERVHIGREGTETFKFCPRCLIKVLEPLTPKIMKR